MRHVRPHPPPIIRRPRRLHIYYGDVRAGVIALRIPSDLTRKVKFRMQGGLLWTSMSRPWSDTFW